MIPKLRENILAIKNYEDEDDAKSVIYNYQYVMGYLQESRARAINPKPFCNVWTDEMGQKINVLKQEDAHGYVGRLIDRFTEWTKGTPDATCFTDVFGGILYDQMIGQGECKHLRYREEKFTNVNVEIKGKKNLVESLHSYIQGQQMNGVNCDACGKKVTFLKRSVFGKLPPHLIIALKRFALDFTTFEAVKINDRLEFPMELDMKPYTAEALMTPEDYKRLDETKIALAAYEAKQAAAKAESKGSEGKSEGKAAAAAAPKFQPSKPAVHAKEYYQYRLKGVVIHTGTVNSGHYYSFIQERLNDPSKEKWYRFDDRSVTPFDPRNLDREAFGGSSGQSAYRNCANGYLLFYDRVPYSKKVAESELKNLSFEASANVALFASKMNKVKKASRARVRLPPKIFHEIWEQNLTYWRDKNVYNDEYFDFVLDLIDSDSKQIAPQQVDISSVDVNKASNPRDALTRMATRFFMMTYSRAANKEKLPRFVASLKRLYTNNVASSAWALNRFSDMRQAWAFIGIFKHPSAAVRSCIADILSIALSQVSPLEQKGYTMEPQPLPTLDMNRPLIGADVKMDSRGFAVGFANLLLKKLLPNAQKGNSWSDLFQILSTFASLGPVEKAFLNRSEVLAGLINMHLGPRSPHPELGTAPAASAMGVQVRRSTADIVGLFKLISSIVKGTQLSDLSDLGREMLTCQPFLDDLLSRGTNHQAAVGINEIANQLCSNMEMTTRVTAAIKEGMLCRAHDEIRPFFRVIMAVTLLEDENQTARVNKFMTMLVEVLQERTKYWKVFDFCVDHIIRMAKKNPLVKAWLAARGELLDSIIQWFTNYPAPPNRNNPDPHMELDWVTNRYRQPQMAFTQSSKNQPYNLPVRDKIDALTKIKNNQELDMENADDSDKALADRKFVKNQLLDVLDEQNHWLVCRVLDTRPGYVTLQYVKYPSAQYTHEREVWNRGIAPHGMFTQR